MAYDDSNLPVPANADAHLAELRRLAHRNCCIGNAYQRASVFSFVLTWAILLMNHLNRNPKGWKWYEVVVFSLTCLFLAVNLLYFSERRAYTKRRRILIDALHEDVRSVGPLLLLLHENQDKDLKTLIHGTLKTLLPRLQFSDARHFTPEQMESLLELLKPQAGSYDLRVAVVQALEQIGDSRAIVPLQAVAAEAIFPDLRLAAQTALDAVQTHAVERERSVTLLRPSDPNGTMPDTLLRPAAAQSDYVPEQLLRPTQQ